MTTTDKMIAALLSAKAHVVRQQFAGKHQQDREDAVEWLREHGAMVAALRNQRRQLPIKWRGNL